MAATTILEGDKVQKLARTVEESTRSTREGVRFFIEPAPGTLARAKNKRHHIVFGRRGSGKSSLLAKVTEDLTIDRLPIAYVDLEEFKGHSYPDVLLSVLIKALGEFKTWLDTAALHLSTRKSFWKDARCLLDPGLPTGDGGGRWGTVSDLDRRPVFAYDACID